MMHVVRSLHLWTGLVLLGVFLASATVIPNPTILILTNSFMMCASVMVGLAYIPIAFKAVRSQSHPDPRQRASRRTIAVALGICYAWNFGALWRVLAIFWLTAGQDPVLINNDIVAFAQSGIGLGALLHLTTVGNPKESDPSMHWTLIAVVVVASLAVGGTILWVHPDNRWIVPLIEPYIPR